MLHTAGVTNWRDRRLRAPSPAYNDLWQSRHRPYMVFKSRF